MSLISLLTNRIHRIKEGTPSFANLVSKIGAAIFGLEAAAYTIPDVPDGWINVLQMVAVIYLIYKGQYQTAADFAEQANQCEDAEVRKKGRLRRFRVLFD